MNKIIYHPPKALGKLILHFKGKWGSISMACEIVSMKLAYKWGSSHIYNVYNGRSPATPKFKDKINQLAYKTFNPERFWLSIHALTKEQKDRWKMVPMAERRKALDEAYAVWASNNIQCEFDCGYSTRAARYFAEEGCPWHKSY